MMMKLKRILPHGYPKSSDCLIGLPLYPAVICSIRHTSGMPAILNVLKVILNKYWRDMNTKSPLISGSSPLFVVVLLQLSSGVLAQTDDDDASSAMEASWISSSEERAGMKLIIAVSIVSGLLLLVAMVLALFEIQKSRIKAVDAETGKV